MQMYILHTSYKTMLSFSTNLNVQPHFYLTERLFSIEEEEMFNPIPTVKEKGNAYLTFSPVSRRDEIEILMHFRVFPPNGEADRHKDVIFTV